MRRRGGARRRVLASVLFTDIVGSTELASRLGDRQWRQVLRAHDRIARAGIKRFGGREIDTTGDGFFATFDQPSDAIECALAIQHELRAVDIDIRAGVHTGEVEVTSDDVGGIAVHVAARVMARADANEVLISSTVRDLLPGANLRVEDRGTHELKGVESPMHLYAVHHDEGAAAAHPGLALAEEPRTRTAPIVVAAIGGAVAVAVLAVVLTRGDDGAITLAPNTVAVLDPATGEVTGGVEVGVTPQAIAFDGDQVWVANFDDQTIQPIDPETGVPGAARSVSNPAGLAVGGGFVWVADGSADAIVRVDPEVGGAGATFDLGALAGDPDAEATDLAFGEGALWVSDAANATVYRLPSPEPDAVRRVELPEGSDPTEVAVGEGFVWVTVPSIPAVARIDAATRRLEILQLTGIPGGVTVGEGAAWVSLPEAGSVVRIDPVTRAQITIDGVGEAPQGLSVGVGKIWVADPGSGSASWINAERNEVAGTTPLASAPWDVACTPDGVWVTITDEGG